MQLVTDVLMRGMLQLPQRPYADVRAYDGTPYYDLSRREVVRILSCSGTSSTSVPYIFTNNTDFQLTADSIDWSIPSGVKPLFGSVFTTEYTYSRLGSAAASTSMMFAGFKVTQDLGPTYPYGGSTTSGIAFNDMASLGQSLLAASLACRALATSDIETAEKYRRGTVLVDDTKKSDDWILQAKEFEQKYDHWKVILRGPVRNFGVAIQLLDVKVFNDMVLEPDERELLNGFYGGGIF